MSGGMGGEATGASVVLTTKGDIVGYDTARKRIGIGADLAVLTADSTNANGLAWTAPAGAGAETHNFASAETVAPTTQTGVTKVTIDSNGISGGDFKIIIDGVTKETITTALFSNRIYNPSTSISLVSANGTGEWDISGSTYTTKSLDFSPQIATYAIGMTFSVDGTKCYIAVENEAIYQYDLTTAFDISTASYSSKSYTHGLANPKGIYFKSDGTYMFLAVFNGSTTRRFPLSTPWDISTVGAQDQSQTTSAYNMDLFISSDGTKLFRADNSGNVLRYDLSPAWSLNSWSANGSVNPASIGVIAGLTFKSDGTVMYCSSFNNSGIITEYSLSTPWDLSTVSYTRSYDADSVTGTGQAGLFWKPDGTNYYVCGDSNDKVYQYEVSSGTFSGSILSTVG